MKISNIKLSNYRNIVNADVNFGDVNIFTGKNSSGKTNLLKGLVYCINSEEKQGKLFNENVTTFGKGYRKTTFETTISDTPQKVCYLSGEKKFTCLNPKQATFIKKIQKVGSFTTDFLMYYSGEKLNGEKNDNQIDWSEYLTSVINKETFDEINNELVFQEVYDALEKSEDKRIIKTSKDTEEESYFKRLHKNYSRGIYQWIERGGEMKSSSGIVHEYVTHQYAPSVAADILDLVSKKELQNKRYLSAEPFSESLFANLVADIQTNEEVHKQFAYELKHYSQGIVTNAYIQTSGDERGQLFVDSPNGPKEIQSISAGTAVMLFFVAIKHWLNLPFRYQSYDAPKVMIFDEIDSNVHPSLLFYLSEIVRSISSKTQIFLSTHSPLFLNQFGKENIYLLKDASQNIDSEKNRVNILSYSEILNQITDNNIREEYENELNSELFSEDVISNLFHG